MKLSDLQAMQAKIAKASELAALISGAESTLSQVEKDIHQLRLYKVDTGGFKADVADVLRIAPTAFDSALKAMLEKVVADAKQELESL